ncbi:hypothetical protein F2Q70_00015582 [Brassica cretica]|nr:hypothetical protein F2Q70_00015582 [Brassica cretica]
MGLFPAGSLDRSTRPLQCLIFDVEFPERVRLAATEDRCELCSRYNDFSSPLASNRCSPSLETMFKPWSTPVTLVVGIKALQSQPRRSGSSSCSSAVLSREFSISTVKSKHGFTRRLLIIAPPLNHKSSIAVLRRHRDYLSRRGGCRNRQNQVSPSGFRYGEESS